MLIELDGEDLRPELGTVEGQWFEMLARKSRLQRRARRARRHHLRPGADLARGDLAGDRDADRGAGAAVRRAAARAASEEEAQLEEQQTQIGNQNEGLVALQAATKSQIDLLSREIDGQQTLLDQGLTEVTRVLTPQRELARLEGVGGPGRGLDRREPRQDRRDRDPAGAARLQGARGRHRRAARARVPGDRDPREAAADPRPHGAALPAGAGLGHRLRQHRRHGAGGDPVGRAGDVHRAEGHAADRAHPHRHHPHRPGARGPGGDPALLRLRPAHHAGAHAGTSPTSRPTPMPTSGPGSTTTRPTSSSTTTRPTSSTT